MPANALVASLCARLVPYCAHAELHLAPPVRHEGALSCHCVTVTQQGAEFLTWGADGKVLSFLMWGADDKVLTYLTWGADDKVLSFFTWGADLPRNVLSFYT